MVRLFIKFGYSFWCGKLMDGEKENTGTVRGEMYLSTVKNQGRARMYFKYYTSKAGRPFNDLSLHEKTIMFEKYFVVNVANL